MMSEKREYPRMGCGFEVSLISNGHFFRDTLVDISEGGARLNLSSQLELAKDVLIRASDDSLAIMAVGDVCWSRAASGGRQVGIKFLYLPEAARSRIRALGR